MSIRKTIITTVVALTLVAMVAPGVAQGVTIEELLAQIAQLQTQLLALQGGSTPSGSVPTACSGITLSRNLVKGSTGSDVKCVQALLNTDAATMIASSGAGSPGNETTYYGSLTVIAVKKFQAKYGTGSLGTVGANTRAKMNSMLAGGTPGTPVVVPTGAGLTAALAYNNPASGTIVDGQALYPLAKLTFTNGDNAEVRITGLKLKRIGVSADASVVNIYLFDGATRLTDGAAVSSTMVNFNNASGLFTVPSGGSKTISVLADINGAASETIGVQVVASTDVTTNASSVKGSYPITGNLHTIATGTLAGVEFNATTSPSSAATIDPQSDFTVWQNSVVVTTRAVDMTRISFRKTGSVKDADLQNFRLYVDGVQVGSSISNISLNSNNESLVTFDLTNSPKRMEAGTRVIKLVADIINGSSLAFTFNLWNSADSTFVDTQYMANVLPDLASDASFTKRSTAEQTIGSGTITITKKSDSPSGNIVNGASNALLARYEIKAAGERVKIENLYVSANVNTAGVSGLRNGALYANGVQIGSTTTLYDTVDSSYDYTTFNLGSSLIVDPGSPVILEVKADIYDTGTGDTTNSIVANSSTVQVVIEGSSSWNNGTGMSSASTVDVPASDVNANSLTVKEGGLSLSANPSYTAQTVVAPITAYKLASFNLAANTAEAINITAINVDLDDVSSYASNLYVKYGTKTTSVKPSITSYRNSWSINEVLAAGATMTFEVYVDVSSLMTAGDGVATLDVDGTTVSSGASADSTAVAGQTINFSTGTFAAAFASTPQNQLVAGNQEVEIGRWKFTSSYQTYTIQELKIDPDAGASSSSNAEDAIVSVSLKDGSTVLATQSFNNIDTNGSTGGYYFTGLNIEVPGTGIPKTLTVVATLTIPSATAGNSGLRIQPSLTYVKEMDPQGTITESVDNANDSNQKDGNSTYVYRTVPTLSLASTTTSNTFTNGQISDLYKFKVTAPAQGDVYVKQFKIALSWSDAITADPLELESLKLLKDGVDITDLVVIQDEDSGISAESTDGVTENNGYIIVVWNGDTEDTIGAGTSSTYTLRGTPQGFVVTGGTDVTHDSVSLTLTPDTAAVTFGSTSVDYIGYLNTDDTARIGSAVSLYTSSTASTSAEAGVFIWSDGSAVAHNATVGAGGTGDWTNGYLIKDSLPSVTWTK